MVEIKGDILKISEGTICHQANCLGKMGAGLALAMKNKWPNAYIFWVDPSQNNEVPYVFNNSGTNQLSLL